MAKKKIGGKKLEIWREIFLLQHTLIVICLANSKEGISSILLIGNLGGIGFGADILNVNVVVAIYYIY